VWNAAQTEAELKVAGVFVEASFVMADGESRETVYVVDAMAPTGCGETP